MNARFPRRRIGMEPGAHQAGARVEQLSPDLSQIIERLPAFADTSDLASSIALKSSPSTSPESGSASLSSRAALSINSFPSPTSSSSSSTPSANGVSAPKLSSQRS